MGTHKLFGKYNYTQTIQTLARKGYTKEEVKQTFTRLGCGDVADNTIKTQFTESKNPKYAKADVRFTADEWKKLDQARSGEEGETGANHDQVLDEQLLNLKKVASSFGGVEKIRQLCDHLVYRDKVSTILANADKYHVAYYEADSFRGPSLHFHQRAIQTHQSRDFLAHVELVYATLASWGMHRMGKGGSKMVGFDVFRGSLDRIKDKILEAQHYTVQHMSPSQWSVLEEIFRGIKVMATGTSLVGNSKVMHHMMPNIVPPIDREYTLRYLQGNTNIANDIDREWGTMKEIISQFFIPIACDPALENRAKSWMGNQDRYPWDTSVMKIIDNLLIGLRKCSAKKKGRD